MRIKSKTVMDQMNAEKPDDVLADLEAKHGSSAPAGSAASSELEVVPKCVTTLADAYEKGMAVMGGRRAGRTWAMRIATAKPHQKQLPPNGEVSERGPLTSEST